MLYEKLEGDKVLCRLCSHQCKINEGKLGFCGVRRNIQGTLYTTVYGKAIASNIDPIEKKPLYHFLPGSRSMSIATIGCNFHCGFCQNWQISQISQKRNESGVQGRWFPPEKVVEKAKQGRCESISYTYTEPTIFFEYAYETAVLAGGAGIRNVFVTNGYMSGEALETIAPYLDAANVDLKAWSDDYYRNNCKARLEPVLNSIRHMKELGIWLELTTLVIPGENDSDRQLEGIAGFIAEVGVEIPWHISRFHPDYQFSDHEATPLETLQRAQAIGKKCGLRYVYLGNVTADSHTYCPHCHEVVVKREAGFGEVTHIRGGKCLSCGAEIEGVWE
jgi:pyruvate formate lyase activating enzyme